MRQYSYTDRFPNGQVNKHFDQRVTQSNVSPHVGRPNSRKGYVMLFQQNAFNAFRVVDGPGYLITVKHKSNRSLDYLQSSTALLSQFQFGAVQFPSISVIDFEQAVSAAWYRKAASFSTNVAEIYATRKDTVNMVTSLIERLAHAAIYIRRRQWRRACNTLGITYRRPRNGTNPAAAWLEYSYGWAPLLGDIHLLLDRPFPEPYQYITVKRTENRNVLSNKHFDSITDALWTETIKVQCTVRAKVVVTNSKLAAASSFGLTNPAPLAWELLPYSSVLDWLLPIGPYLEALTALNGCSISEKSTTTTVHYQGTGVGKLTPSSSYPYPESFKCGRTYWRKTRRLNVLPLAFPKLKNPISLHHFSLASSLLANNLKEMRKTK